MKCLLWIRLIQKYKDADRKCIQYALLYVHVLEPIATLMDRIASFDIVTSWIYMIQKDKTDCIFGLNIANQFQFYDNKFGR